MASKKKLRKKIKKLKQKIKHLTTPREPVVWWAETYWPE